MLRDGSLEEKDYMMLQVNDVKEMEVNMTEDEEKGQRPHSVENPDTELFQRGMNIFMGGWSGWPFSMDTRWTTYRKIGGIRNPSNRWVLLDMRGESINAGNYRVDMAGYPGDESKYCFQQDWPGIYHNNATNFSFADGHCDKQRWLDKRTLVPPVPIPGGRVSSRGNLDIAWMQERTTEKDPVTRSYVGGSPTGARYPNWPHHGYWPDP